MPIGTTQSDPPAGGGLFLHQKITLELRRAILSGEIAPGTRLPSMEELGKQWETSYFTIRQAMKPLAQEGLVEHPRRIGTVVKGDRPTLTRVGVYYGSDILGMPETSFYRSLHACLSERLGERGVDLVPFIDRREESAQGEPLPSLAQAVEARTIQAILILHNHRAEAEWLARLPLPKALIGSTEVDWAVRPDSAQQLQLAFRHLKKSGAKSVGIVANRPRDIEPGATPPLLERFLIEAEKAKLTPHPDWCIAPSRVLPPGEMEPFGYHALMHHHAASSELPDALLSTSDIIGRGVLLALLQLGVKVPDQLRMVQWVNAGTSIFTPLAIDRISLDEPRVAEALITQLDLQMRGQSVVPQQVPGRLLPFSPTPPPTL